MNIDELKIHSRKIKRQAAALLKSTELLDILNKFGETYLIGSYPLDVMWGPDIDIIVKSENIKKSSIDALQEIVDKKLFRKIEYGDFVNFPDGKRPNGYILVLKAVVEGVKWEIEIWFLSDISKELNYHKFLESKINEKNRNKILEAKYSRETTNTSKFELSSYKIYEQILGNVIS